MTQEALNQAADLEIRDTVSRLIDDSAINYEESNYEAGRRDALIDNGKALFIAGAKWRINNAWHFIKEIPKEFKAIIAIRQDGSCEKVYFTDLSRWKSLIKRCKIIKWAYLEDLLPMEESDEQS